MLNCLQIIAYVALTLALIGCGQEKPKQPNIKGITLRDLTPINPTREETELINITLDILAFEIPLDNLYMLTQIWPNLNTDTISFVDTPGFAANDFALGSGQGWMWRHVSEIFEPAGAKRIASERLLMRKGQEDYFQVARLRKKGNIFYFNQSRAYQPVPVDNGILILKIAAEYIPHQRGICTINARPAFKPRGSHLRRKGTQLLVEKHEFSSLGFSIVMSPGDFLLLGPAAFPQDANSIGQFFFIPSRKKPTVRLYAILCTSIID